jgi:hypothetical protein
VVFRVRDLPVPCKVADSVGELDTSGSQRFHSSGLNLVPGALNFLDPAASSLRRSGMFIVRRSSRVCTPFRSAMFNEPAHRDCDIA